MNLKGLEKNVELSTVEVANNSILSLKGNKNPVIFVMENSFGIAQETVLAWLFAYESVWD